MEKENTERNIRASVTEKDKKRKMHKKDDQNYKYVQYYIINASNIRKLKKKKANVC